MADAEAKEGSDTSSNRKRKREVPEIQFISKCKYSTLVQNDLSKYISITTSPSKSTAVGEDEEENDPDAEEEENLEPSQKR